MEVVCWLANGVAMVVGDLVELTVATVLGKWRLYQVEVVVEEIKAVIKMVVGLGWFS